MMSQERIIEKIKKNIKDFTIVTFAIIPATICMIIFSWIVQSINPMFQTGIGMFVGCMGVSFALSVGVILGLQMALKEVKKYKEET